MESTRNENKLLQVILLVLAFVAGGAAAKLWYDTRTVEESPSAETQQVNVPSEEDDSDSEVNIQIEEPEEESTMSMDSSDESEENAEEPLITVEDVALLQDAFAEKYDVDVEEVSVDPSNVDSTGMYVQGGVRLGEGPGSGGIFYAVKEEGSWIIVADGNGLPLCIDLEAYSFPVDMIQGCY